jgi:hypothetical protein
MAALRPSQAGHVVGPVLACSSAFAHFIDAAPGASELVTSARCPSGWRAG